MTKIIKKCKYPMKSGYTIRTIMGKDENGQFFYIAVYLTKDNSLVERFTYRNSTLANAKYRECKNKYALKEDMQQTATPDIEIDYVEKETTGEKPEKSIVKEPPLPFLSDEVRNAILCNDTYTTKSCYEVIRFYENHDDIYERADFVKALYPDKCVGFEVLCGQHVGFQKSEDGLLMWTGSYISRAAENFYPWNILQAYLGGLIGHKIYHPANIHPANIKNPKTKSIADIGQISLFDFDSIKGPTVRTDNSMKKQEELLDFSGSQKVEDPTGCINNSWMPISPEAVADILRTGGGMENSRFRIYAKYQQNYSPENMVNFLMDEYQETGKGFTFGNINIAVWFDAKGMHVHCGKSAKTSSARTMPWKEVEVFIRKLVKEGTYMCNDEVKQVRKTEIQRIGNDVLSFLQDLSDGIPEKLHYLQKKTFPEMHELMVNQLATNEGIDHIFNVVHDTVVNIKNGTMKLRFNHYFNKMDNILNDLIDLRKPWIDYPVKEDVIVRKISFITQDEIDYVLMNGSAFEKGKIRIYEHFIKGLTAAENINFLRNEYGISGSNHALPACDESWKDYNGKGLQIRKGNLLNPDAEVRLTYSQIEKRIRELIQNKTYTINAESVAETTPVSKICQKTDEIKVSALDQTNENMVTAENLQPITEIVHPETQPDLLDWLAIQDTVNDGIQTAISDIAEMSERKKAEIIPANFYQEYVEDDQTQSPFSPKTKFRQNVDAIKLLRMIEMEERNATPVEQEVLARYVGWGGLADAFDSSKTAWADEYTELKGLLSEDEYTSARASTLNAHYTSPVLIKHIYDAIEKFGFQTGNILEPAVGIGNFFALLPEKMRKSKLYGVELDSISGRIAKLLYPLADIRICGFEKTDFPNNFFDIAIGNVPFGDYKVLDAEYDKFHFLIHDYFIAKALDKVRPGGIVAFITTKGTMDKQNPAVRKYISARAELLGAIRLPNTAFKSSANTEVTSDILFLKKRDSVNTEDADWVSLSKTADGIDINNYFAAFPEMIMGKMEIVSGPYGPQATCSPYPDTTLSSMLPGTINRIEGKIDEIELDEDLEGQEDTSIPADLDVKDFSFTLVKDEKTAKDKLYFREGSKMYLANIPAATEKRVRGMLELRDCTYELINSQMMNGADDKILEVRQKLNRLYDTFTQKHGLLTSVGNRRAFENDCSYPMLSALEVLDDEGNFERKADMFFKRTINPPKVITNVDTATEALAVSLNEKACIDLAYMSKLSGKNEQELTNELSGLIFLNPISQDWESADEYLSGNVANKLSIAKTHAETEPRYQVNVEALERVQPKKLDASEIEVRLGATWVEPKYIEDFIRDTFKTSPLMLGNSIKVLISEVTGKWSITNKRFDSQNPIPNKTYGTNRVNGYDLLEDCLNLRDAKVYDYFEEDGKVKAVLNKSETLLAVTKQESIKEEFKEWIFRDQTRRQELCDKYNSLFNVRRPRVFDGSHLQFHGMSPDIELKPHQKSAVARILYGNNTLLAHCVGSGKTFEMTAAAMELRHLGLCHKPMFVVPNHLTEQWASEFLRLYPGAKVLATRQKDFETKNRRRFCSRIATGDYDAIIIGHSQFEKIPISIERQEKMIHRQLDELEYIIQEAERNNGEHFTIKQMESMKKKLEDRLTHLSERSRKDAVITFEQLGVDQLFVDESHSFKNCAKRCRIRQV